MDIYWRKIGYSDDGVLIYIREKLDIVLRQGRYILDIVMMVR